MTVRTGRVRLFLDTGVIIEGCTRSWGASKVVLVLATQRRRYTVVLAHDVEEEISRVLARKSSHLTAEDARALQSDVQGWMARVRLERWPAPLMEDIDHLRPTLLPALRHINDLGPVVTAMQARPDWVISANRAHWSEELAARTGLRIVSPQEFIQRLSPPP